MDARIEKQENLTSSLLKKIDALLRDPLNNNQEIVERFKILEGNDKALFANLKSQNESQEQFSSDTLSKVDAVVQKVQQLHNMVMKILSQSASPPCDHCHEDELKPQNNKRSKTNSVNPKCSSKKCKHSIQRGEKKKKDKLIKPK
jgi:hypothetical protein